MGKKKRNHPDIEEILQRPWCYYCERDFDDLKILINHQKAKHFKCDRCGRRLNTAGGLSVHMTQVHKETLTTIENALPNRSGPEVEIFGMEGIPDDVVTSHQQRVIGQFAQAESERRAATGNAGPGATANGIKKAKFESPSDLKKRLAEHKAKKAADQAAGISSGGNTPMGAGLESQSPGMTQSPGGFPPPAGSPGYGQPPLQYGGPQSNYQSYPQSYGQQGPPQLPQQPSPFAPPGAQQQFQNNQPFAPPQQYQAHNGPAPGQGFSSHGASQFQNGPTFQEGSQFPNGPPQFHNGPPQPFTAATPPVPFQQSQFQPPRNQTPPQIGFQQQRPPTSLSPAPGLPQRPSFGAPPVNAFQMQQMHQGQIPGPPNPAENSFSGRGSGGPPSKPQAASPGENATTLDDLVSGAAREADKAQINSANGNVESKLEAASDEKKGKREKDKNTKLAYSDNNISPEEKMANLPRYAFAPKEHEVGA